MSPFTYFIYPFNGICQLFNESGAGNRFKGRYKDRQLRGTSPPISFNKHIKRKAV